MNRMLCLAVVPMILLAACATPEKAGTLPAATAGSGTLYCWKGRLASEGDRLGCNWAPTVADACRFNEYNYVGKTTVVGEPEKAGRCQNGEWLVKVTTK